MFFVSGKTKAKTSGMQGIKHPQPPVCTDPETPARSKAGGGRIAANTSRHKLSRRVPVTVPASKPVWFKFSLLTHGSKIVCGASRFRGPCAVLCQMLRGLESVEGRSKLMMTTHDDNSDPAVRVLHLSIAPQMSHQKCLPECQQRAEEGCKTHTLLETGLSAQHPQAYMQLCI